MIRTTCSHTEENRRDTEMQRWYLPFPLTQHASLLRVSIAVYYASSEREREASLARSGGSEMKSFSLVALVLSGIGLAAAANEG